MSGKEVEGREEGKSILFKEEDYVLAKAIAYGIAEDLRPKVIHVILKSLHAVDAFAKYRARELAKKGIYVIYNSQVKSLPDGYRLIIDFRLEAVDSRQFRKSWRSLYVSVYDYTKTSREFKEFEKMLERGLVDVGGIAVKDSQEADGDTGEEG